MHLVAVPVQVMQGAVHRWQIVFVLMPDCANFPGEHGVQEFVERVNMWFSLQVRQWLGPGPLQVLQAELQGLQSPFEWKAKGSS